MPDHPAVQPFLHHLVSSVLAPALALSTADGQIEPGGVSGVYVADRRIVSRSVLRLAGMTPAPMRGESTQPGLARFISTPRSLGDEIADPTVVVERVRELQSNGATETITVTSYARTTIEATAELAVECDLADIAAVKSGQPAEALLPAVVTGTLQWASAEGTVVLSADAPAEVLPAGLRWPIRLASGESSRMVVRWRADGGPPPAVVAADRLEAATADPQVDAADSRFGRLLQQGLADLRGLEMADAAEPADRFFAAGAPWYLTLFGRDSLWSSRFALPLGTSLAAGTLRTLARRQGRIVDPATVEEPGKILHELRRAASVHAGVSANRAGRPVTLPPVYYGTVDATPLWISLLHDAWRWGMPEDEVQALVPAVSAALEWARTFGTGDDGFLRYIDRSGHGLANQGWKDSADSVQFADGSLADGPIALCEVQGYAYAAAQQGADLLDAFGVPGAARWRDWAADLQARFREHFWVSDPNGDYPAIALAGSGRPADTVTSNIGHLLGTGLLGAVESEQVIRRLAEPDMNTGFGLRTMSAAAARFNPLGYHTGSVWPHDTAIVIAGLRKVGSTSADALATDLIRGLLAAASAFDYRLPELFGGEQASDGCSPVPYPASCRPQAWAAATAPVLLSAITGIDPDVPGGTLRIAPLAPSPVGALSVRGLPVGADVLDLEVTAGGSVRVPHSPAGLEVFLT
ncbi:MAG: glycogen debranching N-terminal domain-containing protein [Jatrophihabitans sp.]